MLLHVLRKIRLLSVTLATVGADVCLYMFRLLVLRDVLKERLLVGEALVAGVALVRLVSLVAARVGLQVRQLGEGLRATYNFKLKHGISKTTNSYTESHLRVGTCTVCPRCES